MAATDLTVPALPAPFDESPNPSGIRPSGSTERLVRGRVKSLLVSAPSFHHLAPTEQSSLEHHMVKIAGYAAECLRDDWVQSEKLGQRPVAVTRPATALSAADEFEPAAADQIARVTRATLEAISFPDFVSDLIRGSFNAIVDSSIQQMEAYTRLLEDVSKTVDQFMADNITDNQARDWLAQRYPLQIALAPGEPRLTARDGAEDSPAPGWREELGLPEAVDPGDEDAYEEILVPAARRKLAREPIADTVDARADGHQPRHRDRREDPGDDGTPRRHDRPIGATACVRLRLQDLGGRLSRIRPLVGLGVDVGRLRQVDPNPERERAERRRRPDRRSRDPLQVGRLPARTVRQRRRRRDDSPKHPGSGIQPAAMGRERIDACGANRATAGAAGPADRADASGPRPSHATRAGHAAGTASRRGNRDTVRSSRRSDPTTRSKPVAARSRQRRPTGDTSTGPVTCTRWNGDRKRDEYRACWQRFEFDHHTRYERR